MNELIIYNSLHLCLPPKLQNWPYSDFENVFGLSLKVVVSCWPASPLGEIEVAQLSYFSLPDTNQSSPLPTKQEVQSNLFF